MRAKRKKVGASGETRPKWAKITNFFPNILRPFGESSSRFEGKIGFLAKNFKNWASFGVKISIFLKKWRLWVTEYNFLTKYEVFGWDCKKMGVLTALHMYHLRNGSAAVWRGGISDDLKSIIDYRLIQCIRGFCSSSLPIFKLSLQVPWIDSNHDRRSSIFKEFLFTSVLQSPVVSPGLLAAIIERGRNARKRSRNTRVDLCEVIKEQGDCAHKNDGRWLDLVKDIPSDYVPWNSLCCTFREKRTADSSSCLELKRFQKIKN